MVETLKNRIKKSARSQRIKHSIILWKDSLRHLYFNRLVSNFPSHRLRLFLLRRAGATIAKNAAVHSGCEFWNPKGLIIEEGSSIGFSCLLDARRGLRIGKNVCLASQVMIWSLHHDYNNLHFGVAGGCVAIGDYAWLCARSIILPGVEIGEGCVVAAGAVVTKNTEPYSVVGGIPAAEISRREKKEYDYVPSGYKLHIV